MSAPVMYSWRESIRFLGIVLVALGIDLLVWRVLGLTILQGLVFNALCAAVFCFCIEWDSRKELRIRPFRTE
jgi:energy-converting hydrogenase Eha subunit A